jgi:uncharacterized delta-60 repeat protein
MKQAPVSLLTLVSVLHLATTHAVEVDEDFNVQIHGTVHAIASGADASLLVGGEFDQVNGTPGQNLVRLETNGTVDETFNVLVDGAVLSLAATPDGTIYGGGAFNAPSKHILKLSPDGAVDAGLNLGTSTSSRIDCVAVASGGAVAFGGPFRRIDGATAHYVGKLNAAGGLDAQFSSGLLPSFALEAGGDAIALQPDGKLLVGGNFNTATGAAFLVRLNADGTVDGSFSGDHGRMLYPKAIIVLGDGRILVSGTASSSGDGFVRRLNPDGSIDGTFNAPLFGGCVEAIAVAQDGTVIVGGSFPGALARLRADGTKDDSWTLSANGVVKAISIQADEAVLIGGAFSNVGSFERSGIARLKFRTVQQSFATNANGRFVARLAGEEGKSYQVEASSDLQDWTAIGNVVASSAGVEVTDEDSTGRRHRFFRARLLD